LKPKHPRTCRFLEAGLFDAVRSFSDLENRINCLPKDDRGDAFEVFAESYLATQKISQAKNIWPSLRLPPRLVTKFNLGRRKTVGLDGVYETIDGKWYAYEVKFRDSQSLNWGDISSFFGRTELFDQRIVFTNCNRLASEIEDSPNTSCIRGNNLGRLVTDDFSAIRDWLAGIKVEIEVATPDPHQEDALEAILPGLRNHDRLSAIMACGTGKTLLTLWVAEQHRAKTVLVLVPSLALIRQTLHEWLKRTRWRGRVLRNGPT
jgi:predicted helicase